MRLDDRARQAALAVANNILGKIPGRALTNPLAHNQFQPNPFDSGMHPPPAPMVPRDKVNVVATLSVVFAFVFAPVGAILGHLGVSQIRHTGERGRDLARLRMWLPARAVRQPPSRR